MGILVLSLLSLGTVMATVKTTVAMTVATTKHELRVSGRNSRERATLVDKKEVSGRDTASKIRGENHGDEGDNSGRVSILNSNIGSGGQDEVNQIGTGKILGMRSDFVFGGKIGLNINENVDVLSPMNVGLGLKERIGPRLAGPTTCTGLSGCHDSQYP
ncbi:hypothetical protein LWI29_011998 [Acer saccharum]|uniref:Uncharacterized protein n=1 Tax=Acer saccharum TaxID=4024 RepID=A0AA39T4F9_ACESA|nr:hypothetical protein LWI29_011998 [Acer saccharum]